MIAPRLRPGLIILLAMLMLAAQTLLAWHAPSHLHDGAGHHGSHSDSGHHGNALHDHALHDHVLHGHVLLDTSDDESSNSHHCPLGINSHGTAACDTPRDMQAIRSYRLFLHNSIAALCEPLYCGTLPRGPPLNS